MKQNKVLAVSRRLYEEFFRNELSEKERLEFIEEAKRCQASERQFRHNEIYETRNDNSSIN